MSSRTRLVLSIAMSAILFGSARGGTARAQEPSRVGPVWPKLSQSQRDEVMRFGDDFKQFIGRAKSELTFVREAIVFAEANGFRKDRKSTRLNSSHIQKSRMPSSA